MSIRGAIFDFDGTLFDSMGIWETAGADYLATFSLLAEKDLPAKIKALSMRQAAAYLQERYALPLSVEEVMEGINRTVEDFYFHRAMPKEGVIPLLSDLEKKGVKMCVATATDRYQVEAALKRCHMLDYFAEIFTCTEIGHGKDEPYIFEQAATFLQTKKEETVVFEDAIHAARTAKAAGFRVVAIFDRHEKNPAELQALADVYLGSFSEAEKLCTL